MTPATPAAELRWPILLFSAETTQNGTGVGPNTSLSARNSIGITQHRTGAVRFHQSDTVAIKTGTAQTGADYR